MWRFALAGRIGIPVAEIENILGSGTAHAALSEDLDLARNQSVQASPTLLFNESLRRALETPVTGIFRCYNRLRMPVGCGCSPPV